MIHIKDPFKIGDTFRFPFRVKNNSGAEQDITGWAITSQVRRMHGNDLVQDLAYVVHDALTGYAEVYANKAQTAGWTEGPCIMDIVVMDATGNDFTTQTLRFNVTERVTNAGA